MVPRHCQRPNLMVNKAPPGLPSPEVIFHHCRCEAVAVVLAVPMSGCRRLALPIASKRRASSVLERHLLVVPAVGLPHVIVPMAEVCIP